MKTTFMFLFIPLLIFGQVKNDPCFDLVKDGLFINLSCNPQGFHEI